jgi:hypothetical protein
VIASDEQEAVLRARARRFQIASFVGQILFGFAIVMVFAGRESLDLLWKIGAAFPLLVLLEWAVLRAYSRRLAAQMQSTRVANSPLAHLRSAGQTMNPLVLFLTTAFFLVLSALALLFFTFELRDVGLLMDGLLFLGFAVMQGIPLQSWWTGRSR